MKTIIHDEHVTFECSCGGVVVARFVIPTRKFQFALIGTCQKCYEQGRDKTTVRRINKHHIKPRSRFPVTAPKEMKDYDNVVEIDQETHEAWHFVFGNLTPEEAVTFIRMVMIPGTRWSRRELVALQDHIVRRSK